MSLSSSARGLASVIRCSCPGQEVCVLQCCVTGQTACLPLCGWLPACGEVAQCRKFLCGGAGVRNCVECTK